MTIRNDENDKIMVTLINFPLTTLIIKILLQRHFYFSRIPLNKNIAKCTKVKIQVRERMQICLKGFNQIELYQFFHAIINPEVSSPKLLQLSRFTMIVRPQTPFAFCSISLTLSPFCPVCLHGDNVNASHKGPHVPGIRTSHVKEDALLGRIGTLLGEEHFPRATPSYKGVRGSK